MRNFEERKAEVFRRSENRIKARKRNRNRILIVCIPLCLVLSVCSVTLLPGMLPVTMDKASEENAAIPEYTGKNAVCAVQVELISTDSMHQYLGQQPYVLPEDIGQFYYSMESALYADRGNEESKEQDNLSGDNFDVSEELISGSGDRLPDCKITFLIDDGTEVVYTLKGCVLTNETTGKTTTLTDTQREEIVEKLELLIVEEEIK